MSTAVLEPAPEIRARRAGFVPDLLSVAGRAIRSIPREPEAIYPALIVPLFFYAVNLGAFGKVLDGILGAGGAGLSAKEFLLPSSILFAVTGVSRAPALVTDIQDGYFDRLLMTPIRRITLLLGLMVADFVLVIALALPVLAVGFVIGVEFGTGIAGVAVFLLAGAFWGLVFTGFPYAIALKTGNPAAVNASFVLFFPFLFLTTSTLPMYALTPWLQRVSDYNPVTYLLEGLRSLFIGWDAAALAKGAAAVAGVGLVSVSLALSALRSRVRQS